ncbi:MAG: hypothetical protein JXQ29_16275, partial [Planctomycetes bacterium]|nr:hypothetical protein [Planctomycetota bacterium]
MRRFTPVLCVLALLAIGIADAQSVVAPGAATTLAGSSGLNTLLRNSGNPRTYQLGIAASELSAIPRGAVIVGLSWRS